jgi:hypothetical protein
MLSGEDNTNSCSKQQEIDYCVIWLSPGFDPDKEQWLMNEIIKFETRYSLEWCSHTGNRSAADQAYFVIHGSQDLEHRSRFILPDGQCTEARLSVCGDASICQSHLVLSLQ